ncbi:MAG TPA: nicotinate (nicotinamide) nucleotide adenylyltransferase [Tepidisphaeraceae bacterium]|nr:nicotinate (nicotinamide) nucleotide adenylyltransferase [Tepidisphaeraceae bacterium]
MAKLCFGGAFNPIHHGHLLCARAAAEALGLDGVLLIPSHWSPLKAYDTDMASASDRLEMCRLATAGMPGFEIDDCELHRPPPSYTIDTVAHFRQAGWSQVFWLIGSDQVASLPKWHRPHDLLQQTHIVIAARPGWQIDWSLLPPEYAILAQRVVAAPAIEISSTDIRRRVAAGKPIDFLTPPAVCRYIRQRGLYCP